MSMQYKRSFKAYPAWDYQSEIDELYAILDKAKEDM